MSHNPMFQHRMSETPILPLQPILPGLNPDPTICRVGDEYVIATSSCEYYPGLPLYASRDLVTWEPIGHAIDRPAQLDLSRAADSSGLWAPSLRHHDGIWYLTCTLQHTPADGFRSFYVTATDPRGSWSDPIWLDDAVGIDPSLFFHAGRAWWTAARPAQQAAWPHQGEIWMRELDLERGELVGDEHVLWRGSQLGARWTEAPHLFVRGGRFVLITAEGGTDREHSEVVAASDTVTGPYANHTRNPILTHRHLGLDFPIQNVGHVDLVDDQEGRSWAVALGSRTVDGHCIIGRETFLVPARWEDGWPVLAPDTGTVGAELPLPAPASEEQPTLADWTTVRGPADFATEVPDGVELTAAVATAASRPAALLRRLRSPYVRASVDLTLSPGSVGGLLLRRSDRQQLRLEVRAGTAATRVRVIARRAGVDQVEGQCQLDGPTVALRVELEGSDAHFFADDRPVTTTDARILSAETEASFTGTLWGSYVDGGSIVLTGWRDVPLPLPLPTPPGPTTR